MDCAALQTQTKWAALRSPPHRVYCVQCVVCCKLFMLLFACVAVAVVLLLLLCDCCCVCVRFLACACKSVHAHFLSKLLCASNSFSFAFEVLHLSRARSLAPPTLPTPPPTPPKPISRPAPFGWRLPRPPIKAGKYFCRKPTSVSSWCRSSAAARFDISGMISSSIFNSRRVNTQSRDLRIPIITTNIRGNSMEVCEKLLINHSMMRQASWMMVNRWTRLMGTCGGGNQIVRKGFLFQEGTLSKVALKLSKNSCKKAIQITQITSHSFEAWLSTLS